MKRISFAAIAVVSVALTASLTCCNKANSAKIKSEPIEYEFIDTVISSFPADFVYTGKYVVWTDWMNSFYTMPGNLIHIVDPELKREVASVVRQGRGPNEFLDANMDRYNGDTIYVRDLNLPRQVLIPLEEAIAGEKPFIQLPNQEEEEGMTRKIFISRTSQVIYNYDYEDTPFRFICGTDTIPFGKYPVSTDVENRYRLDAGIEYDFQLKILTCRPLSTQQVVLYKRSGNSFELLNDINCAVVDERHGSALGYALTKDYIVTLDYDYAIGEKPAQGRDMKALPRTLYVRDHNGKLLRIFKLDVPTLRLTGCGKDNVIYAITAPLEFELVKIDLSEVMKKK